MRHEKYSVTGKNVKLILTALKKEFKPGFIHKSNDGKHFFYLFEKNYRMQGIVLSGIFIIHITSEKKCVIDSVVAGGRGGIKLIKSGLEFEQSALLVKDIKKTLEKICNSNDWQIK